MSGEQPRGPDGRYLPGSSDVIGDDIPPTVWVDKTESVFGATAETPAPFPGNLTGKFDAAEVQKAAQDVAVKAEAALRLKAQLEQLENEAKAFGINAGDGSPAPGEADSDAEAYFSRSILLLKQKIEEMSKEMKHLSPGYGSKAKQLDDKELEAAQEMMLSVVRDQDGHQMDDRAWHQLRLRFSVKEMQESVQMVGKNFSKTSRELRTCCGRTFEDEFKRLKQLATKGGVYYFDCQVDIIVQLSTAHGL